VIKSRRIVTLLSGEGGIPPGTLEGATGITVFDYRKGVRSIQIRKGSGVTRKKGCPRHNEGETYIESVVLGREGSIRAIQEGG